MSEKRATDVLIIGGGVIGCAIAYQLSKAGVEVSVVERAEIASEASSAAAGLLAPGGVLNGPRTVADLFLASWSITADVLAEVEALSGVSIEYQRTGALHVSTDAEGLRQLHAYAHVWQEHGFEATWLDAHEVWQYEPTLNVTFDTALYIPHATSIRPRLVTRAYATAAHKLGAQIYEHTEVVGLQRSGDRVIGVQTAEGEVIGCKRLVVAAGAWSARVGEWLGIAIPVIPLRGQILSLRQPRVPLQHTIFLDETYLVPKVDQTIYVGATRERVGFDKSNTAGAIAGLLNQALQLMPALSQVELVSIWSGLRPLSQDGNPILGPLPGWENVTLATGHGAGGFELSAITGTTIAELLTTGYVPTLLQAFGPERFGNM